MPAVGADDGLDDGEAEAVAGVFGGVASAVEAFEQMRQVFGQNANAIVCDSQDYLTIFFFQRQLDGAARWGEL